MGGDEAIPAEFTIVLFSSALPIADWSVVVTELSVGYTSAKLDGSSPACFTGCVEGVDWLPVESNRSPTSFLPRFQASLTAGNVR